MAASSGSEVTKEQEVEKPFAGKPHVVILGAGASIAALPNGDRNGKRPTDMKGLSKIETVAPLLEEAGLGDVEDFESAYSDLRLDRSKAEIADKIDEAIHEYYERFQIPDDPTIYDHLILSLRDKDLIASFNWDPLLMQAYARSGRRTLSRPPLAFLHGNVMVGICEKDRIAGTVGNNCSVCKKTFSPVPLLYPVNEKNYEENPFIASEWLRLTEALKSAAWVTVFGYRAPDSDVAAMEQLKKGWGSKEKREFEQFEIIARPGADADQLQGTWDDFMHTHHYDVHFDYFDSWLANHPRRSAEAYWNQYFEAKFIEDNPVPCDLDLVDTIDWYAEIGKFES